MFVCTDWFPDYEWHAATTKKDCSSIYQDSDDDSSISDGDDEENETPNDEILRHSQS